MLSYKHPFERVNKKLYSNKAKTGARLVKRLRKSVQTNETFKLEYKSTDTNTRYSHAVQSNSNR